MTPDPNPPAVDPSPAALWQRLGDWQPDAPGVARPLSRRLMQANGWDAHFTARALEEYRRFLLLAALRDGQVCPSEAVDQVWHTHLLDSQVYFDAFCPRVLGRVLHHHPSRGGAVEAARHGGNYAATLAAYEAHFGLAAPADVWPAPRERFAAQPRHVDRRTHWVLPRPRVFAWLRALAGTGAPLRTGAVPAALLLGVGSAQALGPLVAPGVSGPNFALGYLIAWVVMLVAAMVLHRVGRPGELAAGTPARVPDVLDLAYLAGGAPRVLQTALAQMTQAGVIEPNGKDGWRHAAPLASWPGAHPIAAKLHTAIANDRLALLPEMHIAHELRALDDHAQKQGWLLPEPRAQRGVSLAERAWLIASAVLLIVGGLRTLQGLWNGRPVFFLVFLMFLGLIMTLVTYGACPPRLTRRGRALLDQRRSELSHRKGLGLRDARMPLALALLGAGVLGVSGAALAQSLAPLEPRSPGSGSGDGGSDSSGCSGGGGGGCGGCGGD